MRRLRCSWSSLKPLIIVCTPLALLPLPLVIRKKEAECAYILILMAVYWMTEVIPLSVTALLPSLLFPLFGIMKSSQVASVYFKEFHLLLLGVICLATSIEKWGLHRRIALRLVTGFGVNPGMLMLGFMVGCAFLSMWLSNTSTVAMVMPIVEAVIQQVLNASEQASKDHKGALNGISNPSLQFEDIEAQYDQSEKIKSIEAGITEPVQTAPEPEEPETVKPPPLYNGKYRTCEDHMMCKGLSLCIAYSSSIGGLTTLSGTSTNLIFAEYIYQYYPECTIINFGNWFVLCLPICIIMLILSWIFLHWMYLGSNFRASLCYRQQSEKEKHTAKVLQDQYNSLGPISLQEIITMIIFILMAILWFTRNPGFMPGWSSLFPEALRYGLLISFAHYQQFLALITWKDFQACMPWEISLLVGGGFALAEGTKISGLSTWVAELLTPLGSLPPLATVTIACLIVTSITEVASNAATMTIFLPILAPLAEAIGVNPLYMLIPTALCVSFSFLLPVSNPPNAIVFTYGHLTSMDMVKAGLGVNIIGVLTVLLALTTWGTPLLNLDTYPDWAPVVNGTGV
uniref:Solute carrier family 13 member 1-like n=1 Tax=Sinocyclocheilus grahami TaxID=75366 RepID=A0A672RE77_SINGR